MWAKTKKPVNWVAHKASCTPIAALDLFQCHINSLLDEMDKALAKREPDYGFNMERVSDTELKVMRVPKEGDPHRTTTFMAGSRNITVYYENQNMYTRETLTIQLNWDFKHAKCRFEIDGDCMSLWELSQRTLYDLFFRDDNAEGKTHFGGSGSRA
ncbi:MAG: hypothetical protein OXG06_01370 [Gammaproteobacteria bacterium]|nr:hypothetical protein [Gammaproteobacteria bacterium]